MDSKTIQALLDKYLQGNCTMEEVEKIHAWLKQVHRESNDWPDRPGDDQQVFLDKLFGDINDSIARRAEKSRKRAIRKKLLRVAASLALLFGISLGLYFYQPWSRLFRPTTPAWKTAAYTVEKTAAGEIKELSLPDGSVIWLNAASTLRYPKEFQGDTREVYLEGEAFFDIARDITRPFLIRTATMKTRVLGTRFNVRSYNDDEPAQVVVVSGSVEVSVPEKTNAGQRNVRLKANQMATYAAPEKSTNKKLSKETVTDLEQYTGWKDGRLVFEDTPMTEVKLQLERAFGLKIKLNNVAIARCKITGRFDRSQAVNLTIEAICKSIEAGFRMEKDTVYISGQGCNH